MTLRVTLSYFVEPNPARRGWRTRHGYASHGLRFDVKTGDESIAEFRRRLNKQATAEDGELADRIGITLANLSILEDRQGPGGALRAGYLLLAVGLAATVWPLVINHSPQWPLMNSVVCSLLAAVSVLAAVGIRYALQRLPVLFFEIIWKSIWLIAVALPLWSANHIDARTWETVTDCLTVVILIPLIPWRYVVSHYVTKPGDRWKGDHSTRSASTGSTLSARRAGT